MNFTDTAFKISNSNPSGVLFYLDGKTGTDEDGYGTFSLEVKEKVYQLETYRVSSTLPKELSSDLGFLHGIDVNEMLTSTLENEVKVNNQKLLLSKYYYLSEITRNNELRKSRWNRFLLRFISESHFCFHFENYNDMIKKILFKSNLIGHKTRRGNADFIVCPPKYSTYIMESPSFVYKDTKEIKISDPGVIDFIGTIGDRIQVFVDRNSEYTENRILIGKKTKEQDCGVYFVQGDKSTDEILDEIGNKTQSLRCRQAIISPEGAEISFGIIRVSDSKRPFWKKLLFIK
jgi:hypothetical protein